MASESASLQGKKQARRFRSIGSNRLERWPAVLVLQPQLRTSTNLPAIAAAAAMAGDTRCVRPL